MEDNKKYPASKFLFYLHTNNVKPMKGFFDIILSDLIKRYDSKLSSPYTSLLLLCIKFYDKEHDIDFLKFSLQLIDNILKLEKENRIISVYSINKYQILKRMRSLNKKEKEHIVTIKNEYILDIEFQLCCSILLDETSITSKKLDTLKLENTNRYEQFTKYPIYSLFLSLNEKT